MLRLDSLEDIIHQLDATHEHLDSRSIRTLLLSDNEEHRILGILLRACDLYKSGFPDQSLQFLATSRHRTGYTPLPVIANIAWLSHKLNQDQEAAYHCLSFAKDSLRLGYADLALEAICATMILDTQGRYEITRDPTLAAEIAALYEQIYQAIPRAPTCQENHHNPTNHLRIALIVPNLVDDVIAYTQRVIYFARHLDRQQYDLRVYSSENHTGRKQPLFPVGCLHGGSSERGRKTLQILGDYNVPVHLVPRDKTFSQAALYLSQRLQAEGTDVVIFQGGLSTPIDWLTARSAAIPVKMSIHVGSSMMVPGMDATFFDNPANIERESSQWKSTFGDRVVLKKGTDIEYLKQQRALTRSQWGIPNDAIVIGTLSNHLDRRMSSGYSKTIAQLMQANPSVWFLGFGAMDVPEIRPHFKAHHVEERLRFGGRQTASGAALKVLDIYASEFPVSGSQSVIEAMACGIPVAAMPWSNVHAESAAAQIVGKDWAVAMQDISGYTQLLQNWISNPSERHMAGRLMQDYATEHYDISTYINRCMETALSIYKQKAVAQSTEGEICLSR